MNISRKLSLTLAAASFLLACSGGDKDSGADAGPSFDAVPEVDATPVTATIEDLCDARGPFVAFVDKFATCQPELVTILGSLPISSTIAQICTNGNQPYIDDGSLTLGPKSLLAGCLAGIQAADCLTFELEFVAACEGLLVGQVQPGESCDSSDTCTEGHFCDESGSADCGFCAVVKPAGNVCESGDECADGFCVDGECAGDGLVASPCLDNDNCRGRLVCDSPSGTCADPGSYQADDSCEQFDGECGFPFSGMYCNSAAKGGGKCESFRALGEPCNNATGQLCDLLNKEACDTGDTQTCVPAEVQADGEECDLLGGTVCMGGSSCDEDDGQCKPFAADGEACEEDAGVGCDFLLECIGGSCQAGTHTGLCSE